MPDYERIFAEEGDRLWGLLYRMTGSAAQADDLLQDTFERAMTRPPEDTGRAWGPWLATVASNLARDALRRRKHRAYPGPWLPEPAPVPPPLVDTVTPEARYGARESATFAFLKALETLTPTQRVVLLLRDVFDYSTAETAEALELSRSNVKVTLHRARKKMRPYDERRPSLDPDEVGETLQALMTALLAGDEARVAELLAPDVVFVSDAGGEFTAATRPVTGREKVARLLAGLTAKVDGEPTFEVRELNGLPAFVVHASSETPNTAETMVVRCDVIDGVVVALDTVQATAKLERLLSDE